MEKTAKITKKMILTAIKEVVKDMDNVAGIPTADVIAYADTTIDQLDKKTAKAREKAAEKKAGGDELYALVEAALTDTPQTREEILAKIEFDGVTVAKVGARLTQLVTNGIADKADIKTADKRTVKGYSLIAAAATEEE